MIADQQLAIGNEELVAWVNEIKNLCEPDSVYWCDGSDAENQLMIAKLIESKTLVKLNEAKRPTSYLALSDPSDVARVEDRTFICSESAYDAGPTNNWVNPTEMKAKLSVAFRCGRQGAEDRYRLDHVPACQLQLQDPLHAP